MSCCTNSAENWWIQESRVTLRMVLGHVVLPKLHEASGGVLERGHTWVTRLGVDGF